MSQHFIIGLGSTGGRVLRELRKAIRQEYPKGGGEPVEPGIPAAAQLGYLFVDSDNDQLNNTDSWKVFGESVRLSPPQLLAIKDGDLGAAVRAIDDFPAIKPWIGDNKRLREVFRDTNGAPGANQVRRYGRFLFASAASTFRDRVADEVDRLHRAGGTGGVTFHVCGTLGGGTGGGSIVDALTILRSLYPNSAHYPIYLYVLATNAQVGTKVNVSNFYANQYAALMELNAMRLNSWYPHAVMGQGERTENIVDRFQCCYIITDKNRNNLHLATEEQEQLIAEYLFHRAVLLAKSPPPSGLTYTWTLQDVEQFRDHQKRATRFASLGVKRWVVPAAEIREKVGMDFMACAARQMIWDNWEREHGYLDIERPLDIPDEVSKSDESTQWRLAEAQLLLDTGFELTDKDDPVTSWRDEWRRVISANCKDVRESQIQNKPVWQQDVRTRADEHYRRGFRQRGVEVYFRDKVRDSAKDYAVAIRRTIENDLFKRWRNGFCGLVDVRRIVEWLLAELDRRESSIDSEIKDCADDVRNGERFIEQAQRDWADLGLWALVFRSKRERQFRLFEQRLTKLMISRTERQALDFKRAVLQQAKTEIANLQGLVTAAAKSFTDFATTARKQADERCAPEAVRQFQARHVREYEPETIAQVVADLRTSRSAQDAFGENIRAAIEQQLTPYPDFRKLKDWAATTRLSEAFDALSYECAAQQHEILAAGGKYPNLLRAGIVDALRNRYGTDHASLRDDVEKFVKSAAAAYILDSAQKQPNQDLETSHWPDMPRKHLAIFIPIAANTTDPFEQVLLNCFQRAVAGNVEIVPTDRAHEISIVATDYWMCARFFSTVSGLKQRYVERLASNKEAAVGQVHLEDKPEDHLVDLMLSSSTPAA